MTALSDLRARLEAAAGPSREMDVRLDWTLKGLSFTDDEVVENARPRQATDNASVPMGCAADGWIEHYTASLDAALALVEKKLPGSGWDIDYFSKSSPPEARVYFEPRLYPRGRHRMATGETPALAILIALVSALEAQLKTSG